MNYSGVMRMKMNRKTAAAAILAVSMLSMSACGKTEFACTDNSEKSMTVKAEKAPKGDFFMTGTLEVDEGEQIIITSEMTKGSIKLDFINTEGNDDIEKLPEIGNEAQLTVEASGSQINTCGIEEGDYMLKAEVTEKATGTVTISIQPPEGNEGTDAEVK